jgi:mannosyl-3-phosphoglycerate phosphatase
VASCPIVAFSDIDGVFERASDRALASARDVLAEAQSESGCALPLVLCSSRTRAELELFQHKLGLAHPFVCENGGATLVPQGYFGFAVPGARSLPGYEAVEYGGAYADVVQLLRRIARRLHVEISGFSDMSIEAVARVCGMPLLQARLAKLREYDEPFRVLDPDPLASARFVKAAQAMGLRCTTVNAFVHAGTHPDVREGVTLVRSLYRRAFGTVTTLGLTRAMVDANLVPVVDHAVVVHDDDVARGAVDVVGWAEAVVDVARQLRERRINAPNAPAKPAPTH